MPELSAGGWLLRAPVPEGIFTLAIEADDATATAVHAAFADRCQPLLRQAAGGGAWVSVRARSWAAVTAQTAKAAMTRTLCRRTAV